MDPGLVCVQRRGWPDSHAPGRRGHFLDCSFCTGPPIATYLQSVSHCPANRQHHDQSRPDPRSASEHSRARRRRILHGHLGAEGTPQLDGTGKVPPAARSRTRRHGGSRCSPQEVDNSAISGLVSIADASNNRCHPCLHSARRLARTKRRLSEVLKRVRW
jgi:hypothetical protein